MSKVKPVWWRRKGLKRWHRDAKLEAWDAEGRRSMLQDGAIARICDLRIWATSDCEVSRDPNVEPKCPKCAKAGG